MAGHKGGSNLLSSEGLRGLPREVVFKLRAED